MDAGATAIIIHNVRRKRIESAIAGSNNMIDACITSDGEGMFTTSGIAVPIEYKLHSRDRRDVSS